MTALWPWSVAAACLLGWALHLASVRGRAVRLAALAEGAVGVVGAGSPGERLSRGVRALIDREAGLGARLAQLHPATGLPTREPLLARMAGDGLGVLALLAFTDYERLCGFDPGLGDRMLGRLAKRVAAMLPPSRFLAHVDRGHLAIWTAGEAKEGDAAELDALRYALGDRLVEDGCEILPEVALRRVGFDARDASPRFALTRALAAFRAPEADGASDGEPADPHVAARDRFLLEQDLRQAVARAELMLHYQPLIDATDARVCGAEALLRWDHPTRGLVSPSRFVPVMEEIGLAGEIGLWTLNAAVREAKRWSGAGLGPLRVAVNVSGRQLERADLGVLVERTLQRHSAGADLLEIELTESVAMGDGASAARLFGALHDLGVTIAIDDFGTGFSSLSTLRTLSFDKIKIDREFVTGVHIRRDSQAICQSVIALGRGLGIDVLAEGVEHRAEYAWLRRNGCRLFQGFYFSPPLPGGEFTDFVRDRDRLARLLALDEGAGGDAGGDGAERRFHERRQA